MRIRVISLGVAMALVLFGLPCPTRAQQPKLTLQQYLSQNTEAIETATIGEWSVKHPGELAETPGNQEQDSEADGSDEESVGNLEGHWCLRSIAEIDLAGDAHVRRIALFYQPLVERIYGKPLPPLPAERGSALREHGCRLVNILHEFKSGADPGELAEAIARQIPGERSEEPGSFIQNVSQSSYWWPVDSFHKSDFYTLFIHRSRARSSTEDSRNVSPTVLLRWRRLSDNYGPPSSNTIEPETGQASLPLRAAMLARLPLQPTLEMLSFLSPQVGVYWQQPPFHCERELLPVLRNWLTLASKSAPEQRAAALLLADRVAGRLSDCDVFIDSADYVPPGEQPEGSADTLRNGLHELGIETGESARPGPEYYTGSLLPQVLKLAPSGEMNELYWIAVLDQRCQWSPISDSDCSDFIRDGERFLSRYPNDEWTPSIHLILAEAYSITEGGGSADGNAADAELLNKAADHYRAWYATSMNAQDRALVWQEIWGIDAGIGAWLMVPGELRR